MVDVGFHDNYWVAKDFAKEGDGYHVQRIAMAIAADPGFRIYG